MGNSQKLLDASRTGDIQLVCKLLDKIRRVSGGTLSSFRVCANINQRDMNGFTPLHHACLNGHSAIVRLLLAHSAATDIQDKCGAMPLFCAAWAGHYEIVQLLLMQPRTVSNINALTHKNETALHCAAEQGYTAVLSILLDCGADATLRNDKFRTPLDLAAEFGRLEAVQILISTNPALLDPFKAYKDGIVNTCYLQNRPTMHTLTCLHLASSNGHQKVVETLLEAGVDVNILTHNGTALHEAAFKRKKLVVNCLLLYGVNTNIEDSKGRTALELLADCPTDLSNDIISLIKDFCENKLTTSQTHAKLTQNKPFVKDENQNSEDFASKNKSHFKNTTKYSKTSKNNLKSSHSTPFLENLNNSSESSKSSKSLFETPVTDYLEMKPCSNSRPESKCNSLNSLSTSLWRLSKNANKTIKTFEINEDNRTENCTGKGYVNLIPARTENKQEIYVDMRESCSTDSSQSTFPEQTKDLTSIETEVTQQLDEISWQKNLRNIEIRKQTDINYSPSPETPPPSVQQAESEIFEMIQFKTTRKRNQDYEAYDFRPATDSYCVEEFEADIPFAGLFKGSTKTLANEDSSLYKFNENEVWAQINSIFESIDKEVATASTEKALEASIKIRNPSDLILGIPQLASSKWHHDVKAFINNEISYKVYYLGSTIVKNLEGELSSRKSIQKLKRDKASMEREQDVSLLRDCSNSTKILKNHNKETLLKVCIVLSYAGVKFIDHKNNLTMCLHAIENISCVCQDAEDKRHFAYITKEDELNYCHVFMVNEESLASEITLTLAQAFEIAYQMSLYEKKDSN